MKLTHIASALTLATASLFGASAQAADLTLELTNLTHGIHFTPRLVVAHTADVDIFQAGTAASSALATQAEGGDPADLIALLGNANNTNETFGGLLAPGVVAPYATMTNVPDEQAYLSMTAMMLPTNDGFIGIDSWKIPTTPGTYFININAYDAGSEANDEIIGGGALGVAGFPAPPPVVASGTGTGGTGVTNTAEGFVHIHRGNLGDTNETGGVSDIDSRKHRWLNPVARLKVVVAESAQ